MMKRRPNAATLECLHAAGLRATRQRLAVCRLLFAGTDRHVTAEGLHSEAQAASIAVSLATVYNALHQFVDSGLLREVVVDSGKSYFDTNTSQHHHFYFEASGRLEDIPAGDLTLARVPPAPHGAQVVRVDVVIRLTETDENILQYHLLLY